MPMHWQQRLRLRVLRGGLRSLALQVRELDPALCRRLGIPTAKRLDALVRRIDAAYEGSVNAPLEQPPAGAGE